jgi:hypothetical protein
MDGSILLEMRTTGRPYEHCKPPSGSEKGNDFD